MTVLWVVCGSRGRGEPRLETCRPASPTMEHEESTTFVKSAGGSWGRGVAPADTSSRLLLATIPHACGQV